MWALSIRAPVRARRWRPCRRSRSCATFNSRAREGATASSAVRASGAKPFNSRVREGATRAFVMPGLADSFQFARP